MQIPEVVVAAINVSEGMPTKLMSSMSNNKSIVFFGQ